MAPSLALCGAGMIAGAHAAAAHQLGMPVVAVASRSGARAERLAGGVGARAVAYDDLPAGADIVAVATPPQCHAADALRLLEAGAAVLLEKPLCTTLEQADALVAAAARHPGRLLYGENLAYAPVVQRLIAATPRVGRLTHLEVRSLQGLPTWGDFTSPEWGGGVLFDLGVHPLAVAVMAANAAGEGRVTGVEAVLRGGQGHASDEHAETTLHFRSGFTASVVASWQAGPEPLWDVQVAGTEGVLRADLQPSIRLEYNGDEVALPSASGPAAPLATLGYTAQLQALVDAARAGEDPVMSATFGREILQIVMAAYASAGHGGELVALPYRGPRDRNPLETWHG